MENKINFKSKEELNAMNIQSDLDHSKTQLNKKNEQINELRGLCTKLELDYNNATEQVTLLKKDKQMMDNEIQSMQTDFTRIASQLSK